MFTLSIRYTLNPNKLNEFKTYVEAEQGPIRDSGACRSSKGADTRSTRNADVPRDRDQGRRPGREQYFIQRGNHESITNNGNSEDGSG